jgi:hypothetical protein
VKAWADFVLETDRFRRIILVPDTFVAEDDARVIGACGNGNVVFERYLVRKNKGNISRDRSGRNRSRSPDTTE